MANSTNYNINSGNYLTGFINSTNAWQQSMIDKANEENVARIENQSKDFFEQHLNATNDTIKNQSGSACNTNNIALLILNAAKDAGPDKYREYSSLKEPIDIIDHFTDKNKGRGYEQYINQCMSGKIDLNTLSQKLRLGGTPNSNSIVIPNMSNSQYTYDVQGGPNYNWLKRGAGIWGANEGLGWLGKQMYKSQYGDTSKYINAVNRYGTKTDAIKEWEKALSAAEKAGKQDLVDYYQGLLAEGYNSKASGKPVNPTNTALKYGIWGDNAASRQRANKARTKIWTLNVAPALIESNSTVDMQSILDSLSPDLFVQKDPVQKEEYKKLIDEVKDAYSKEYTPEELKNFKLKDSQALKVDLGKNIPNSYYNGKPLDGKYDNIVAYLQKTIANKNRELLKKEYGEEILKYIDDFSDLTDFGQSQYNRVSSVAVDNAVKQGVKEITNLNLDEGGKNLINNKSVKTAVGNFLDKIRISNLFKKGYDSITKNKKLLALIGLGAAFLKNPVAQAGLTALDIAGDVDMANEAGNFIDDYRKFVPKVQRIHARFADKDTRIGGEFAGMTEEEKEKKYPTEEVLKDLQWLSDNGYEDFLETYFQYNMPDFLGGKSIKSVDFDDLWDYVGGRLKNVDDEDSPSIKRNRNADAIKSIGKKQ